MEDYTIVEKYQQRKNKAIAIKPFFNPTRQNMGLENYGMALHDGVYHEETLACLEMNGVKRYVVFKMKMQCFYVVRYDENTPKIRRK